MRELDWTLLLPDMLAQLAQGKTVQVSATGSSMAPFLRACDTVVLAPLPARQPLAGDIFLFRRADGSYVIHRAYLVQPDGGLTMLGDAQFTPENISPSQLLAFVPRILRNGKKAVPCDTDDARRRAVRRMHARMAHPQRERRRMLWRERAAHLLKKRKK